LIDDFTNGSCFDFWEPSTWRRKKKKDLPNESGRFYVCEHRWLLWFWCVFFSPYSCTFFCSLPYFRPVSRMIMFPNIGMYLRTYLSTALPSSHDYLSIYPLVSGYSFLSHREIDSFFFFSFWRYMHMHTYITTEIPNPSSSSLHNNHPTCRNDRESAPRTRC
jgi:hypothetical protein